MIDIPGEKFEGHNWDELPEVVARFYEPWQRILDEYADVYDLEDSKEGLPAFVQKGMWLVSLAVELQKWPSIRRLYALVHHGVIELKRGPHCLFQQEALLLSAVHEGFFHVDILRCRGITVWDRWDPEPLGEGTASQVAALVSEIVQKA